MHRLRHNSESHYETNGAVGAVADKTSVWTAIFDYEATGEDELSLQKGDKVEVLSTDSKISGDEGKQTCIGETLC